MNNKRTIGIILAIVSALFYGAYPPMVRMVYDMGGNATFMLLATSFARFTGFGLLCLCKRKPILTTKDDRRLAVFGGLLQAVSNVGIFFALVYLPGAIVISLLFTHTLFQLLLMAWRKEAVIDRQTLFTALIALLGIALALRAWQVQSLNWSGIGFALLGAVMTAVRMYLFGHQAKTKDPAVFGTETFLFSTLFLGAFALFHAPQLPSDSSAYIWAVLGCTTMVLGTIAMLYGIVLMGAFSFSMIGKLEPIFTALLSVLFVGEILAWDQYAGIAVVISSLAAYQYFEHRKIAVAENTLQ